MMPVKATENPIICSTAVSIFLLFYHLAAAASTIGTAFPRVILNHSTNLPNTLRTYQVDRRYAGYRRPHAARGMGARARVSVTNAEISNLKPRANHQRRRAVTARGVDYPTIRVGSQLLVAATFTRVQAPNVSTHDDDTNHSDVRGAIHSDVRGAPPSEPGLHPWPRR
jgi:hypothetical protein